DRAKKGDLGCGAVPGGAARLHAQRQLDGRVPPDSQAVRGDARGWPLSMRRALALGFLSCLADVARGQSPRAANPERPTFATHAYAVAPGYAELEQGVRVAGGDAGGATGGGERGRTQEAPCRRESRAGGARRRRVAAPLVSLGGRGGRARPLRAHD